MSEKTEKQIDEEAVDRFAEAMKEKLAKARAKGRAGWHDRRQCSVHCLARLLIEHLQKANPGNFEDIGNLAMMLSMREAPPAVLQLAMDELVRDKFQAATRPEQFMPRLDEWPEDANWCATDRDACALFCRDEPEIEYDLYGAPTWKPTSKVWSVKVLGRHSSPIGVDNFAKVSREQMEAWEAENE